MESTCFAQFLAQNLVSKPKEDTLLSRNLVVRLTATHLSCFITSHYALKLVKDSIRYKNGQQSARR
jgi:hypothetical protein